MELARIYREVCVALPADRPALESLDRAEKILTTYRLDDKRTNDAPTPSRGDLEALARAIGHVRALKDVYSITAEIDPLFSAGARCVDALRAVGTLRLFRETIEFLRANDLNIEVAERPHPSGASELGFLVRSNGAAPASEGKEWEEMIDRVFDVFEDRAAYVSESERRTVRSALEKIRNLHATLETLDEVVAKHGAPVDDAAAPIAKLARASKALGKDDLAMAIPRFMANGEGRAAAYSALIFAMREPEMRHTLAVIEGEPFRHFTTRLIERTVTDDGPRVAHEMNRLAGLVRMHAPPPTEEVPSANGPKNTPAMTERANLAEKLSFLRESRGERFDALLDDISRKVGPKAAIERYHLLARCCRSREGEGLAENLLSLEPKIVTLPKERFTTYLDELRVGIALKPKLPAASLLPATIGECVRTGGVTRPAAPAVGRDPREIEVISQLNATGLDGEMTLTLIKHGFHHRGAMFTGHRTISRQGVLSIAEAKADSSRADLEDCLDTLIRRGAVVQHVKPGGLALNRIGDISEPALRAAVSYVESFWAEHRNT